MPEKGRMGDCFSPVPGRVAFFLIKILEKLMLHSIDKDVRQTNISVCQVMGNAS